MRPAAVEYSILKKGVVDYDFKPSIFIRFSIISPPLKVDVFGTRPVLR